MFRMEASTASGRRNGDCKCRAYRPRFARLNSGTTPPSDCSIPCGNTIGRHCGGGTAEFVVETHETATIWLSDASLQIRAHVHGRIEEQFSATPYLRCHHCRGFYE